MSEILKNDPLAQKIERVLAQEIEHARNERAIQRKLNAERYDKLRAWLTENGFYCSTSIETDHDENAIYGPTFEQAVDALPQPEGAHLSCPDCQKCKRHAYSDATTPGFFYDRCEKHRRPEPEEKA